MHQVQEHSRLISSFASTRLSQTSQNSSRQVSLSTLKLHSHRKRPECVHKRSITNFPLPTGDEFSSLRSRFLLTLLCFDLRSDQLYFHPASLSFIGTRKRSSSAAETLSFAMDPLPQFSRIAPPRSRRPPSLRSFRPSTHSLSALATYLSFLLASSWVSSVSAQNANTAINLDEMETMCVLSSPSLRTHIRIWPDSTTMKQVQFWR